MASPLENSRLITTYISSLVIYSFHVNPRMTEDVTHALWNTFFCQLCANRLDSLFVAPQLRIYTSPRDYVPAGPDTSFRTVADSQARGVITDFCILSPIVEMRNQGLVTRAELARILASFPPTPGGILSYLSAAFIRSITIPLLAELKLAVSRSLGNVVLYTIRLNELLEKARFQVDEQALCLFCSTKYAGQEGVVLIAACGSWWQVRYATRSQLIDKFFDDSDYFQRFDNSEDGDEPGNPDGVTEELLIAEELLTPGTAPIDLQQKIDRAIAARRVKDKKDKNDAKHSTNEQRRVAHLPHQDPDLRALLLHIAGCGRQSVYPEEQVIETCRLRANYPLHHELIPRGLVPSFSDRAAIPATIDLQTDWSQPLCVGSALSDSYADLIRQKLESIQPY